MDEAKNHALPTFAMLVGIGCILCTLVTFITMGHGDNGGCFPSCAPSTTAAAWAAAWC